VDTVIGYELRYQRTPHLQRYIHTKEAKTHKAEKKLFTRAHLEERSGTVDQAVDYCTKQGDYEEYGEKPKSQKGKGEREKKLWKRAFEVAEADDSETLNEEEPRR